MAVGEPEEGHMPQIALVLSKWNLYLVVDQKPGSLYWGPCKRQNPRNWAECRGRPNVRVKQLKSEHWFDLSQSIPEPYGGPQTALQFGV